MIHMMVNAAYVTVACLILKIGPGVLLYWVLYGFSDPSSYFFFFSFTLPPKTMVCRFNVHRAHWHTKWKALENFIRAQREREKFSFSPNTNKFTLYIYIYSLESLICDIAIQNHKRTKLWVVDFTGYPTVFSDTQSWKEYWTYIKSTSMTGNIVQNRMV